MNKTFAIRSTRPEEQKSGSDIIYGTGEKVPFRTEGQLFIQETGEKASGEKTFDYHTGLEEKHIQYSQFFNKEEKEALIKQQKEAIKFLGEVYGKDRLKPSNDYFWKDNSSLVINNETLSQFFSFTTPSGEKNPEHILLYWTIIGGGYSDLIAPSHEAALNFGLPFYLTEIEAEAERRTEDISSKVKANYLLHELSEKKSTDDMLWLAWMLHPANFGYTQKTPKATLFAAHAQYIEGTLVKTGKKACSKQFIDAVGLLKTDKTSAIATAIVRAGDYFGLIFTNKEGQLETRANHTLLGPDHETAVETLLKPANLPELELLRTEVEEKIK